MKRVLLILSYLIGISGMTLLHLVDWKIGLGTALFVLGVFLFYVQEDL